MQRKAVVHSHLRKYGNENMRFKRHLNIAVYEIKELLNIVVYEIKELQLSTKRQIGRKVTSSPGKQLLKATREIMQPNLVKTMIRVLYTRKVSVVWQMHLKKSRLGCRTCCQILLIQEGF